jgi:hypothetical protein
MHFAVRVYRGMEGNNTLLILALDEDGVTKGFTVMPLQGQHQRKNPYTHWVGRCMSPRAVARGKNPCQERNQSSSS